VWKKKGWRKIGKRTLFQTKKGTTECKRTTGPTDGSWGVFSQKKIRKDPKTNQHGVTDLERSQKTKEEGKRRHPGWTPQGVRRGGGLERQGGSCRNPSREDGRKIKTPGGKTNQKGCTTERNARQDTRSHRRESILIKDGKGGMMIFMGIREKCGGNQLDYSWRGSWEVDHG